MERVEVPVVVSGGRYDYDSLPLLQWHNFPKPKQFTMIDRGEASMGCIMKIAQSLIVKPSNG
jgi:hypothetical protein